MLYEVITKLFERSLDGVRRLAGDTGNGSWALTVGTVTAGAGDTQHLPASDFVCRSYRNNFV